MSAFTARLHASAGDCAHVCPRRLLPPDTLQPLFPEGRVPRELSEKGCVVCAAAAGWLASSLQEGTLSNWLCCGPGSGSQAWPTAPRVESADSGDLGAALWVPELGGGGSAVGAEGLRTRARARVRVVGGSALAGRRGTACLRPQPRRLSCRSSRARQDRAAALPSALTRGTRGVPPSGAPGALPGPAWQALCGSGAREGGGLFLVVEIIYFYLFTDRYIYIFIRGNAAGTIRCHPPGWCPSTYLCCPQ